MNFLKAMEFKTIQTWWGIERLLPLRQLKQAEE